MTHIFIEARYEKTSEYVFLDTVIRNLGFTEEQYKIICVDGCIFRRIPVQHFR